MVQEKNRVIMIITEIQQLADVNSIHGHGRHSTIEMEIILKIEQEIVLLTIQYMMSLLFIISNVRPGCIFVPLPSSSVS